MGSPAWLDKLEKFSGTFLDSCASLKPSLGSVDVDETVEACRGAAASALFASCSVESGICPATDETFSLVGNDRSTTGETGSVPCIEKEDRASDGRGGEWGVVPWVKTADLLNACGGGV